MISVFSFGEVSRYVDNSLYVKAADSNFMMEKAVSRGGYQNVTERIVVTPQEATHVCIVGASYNPDCKVARHYDGRYYGHEFIYELNEYPELREWVNNAPFAQWQGNGYFKISQNNLIGLQLPELVQQLVKGSVKEKRLNYDNWQQTMGTPQAYHDSVLPFIQWAESLEVEPLILLTSD